MEGENTGEMQETMCRDHPGGMEKIERESNTIFIRNRNHPFGAALITKARF